MYKFKSNIFKDINKYSNKLSTIIINQKITNESQQNKRKKFSTTLIRRNDVNMQIPISKRSLIKDYMDLSKFKLSSLVLLSAMFGYAVAPGAFEASTFLISSIGTGMCIGSANAINQYIEDKLDAKMKRTRLRPIPTGRISKEHALRFGTILGSMGGSMLYFGCGALPAALAVANIGIYTMMYTPLKTRSTLNTYVGAVVGGIPPMIGWAACSGGIDLASLVPFAILYIWQIPHFLALSWNLREDYIKGGYKMLSVVKQESVPLWALVYSVATLPLGAAAAYCGITDLSFAFDSLLLDFWLIHKAQIFYHNPNNQTARDLFFLTLKWLPAFMILMIIHHYVNEKFLKSPEK